MLILTRKPSERILIGDDGPNQIIIEVKKILSENRVSIGVHAPREVAITREELKGNRDDREANHS